MASLFDMMLPTPAGISGVKEIVARIDSMKFGGSYIKPDYINYQPEVKYKSELKSLNVKGVLNPHLHENTPQVNIANVEEIESPSPRTTLGEYTCESDESSGDCFSQDNEAFSDELPEMLDDHEDHINPKEIKKPKQKKQTSPKNKAHDISKLFFHLSKAFEIIGNLVEK